MAQLTYQVLKKPIDERIIDAACIYWDVDRSYFDKKKRKETAECVYRKGIIYTLIKEHTNCTFTSLASRFGFTGHEPVIKAIDTTEAQKRVSREVSNDLNQIFHLASRIDADLLQVNVSLINNKIEIS